MTEITAVSLFAGVGGFDLAMERNGINVVAAVEIDKHARGVLAHRFPNTKLFNDIKDVTGDDLITAGFIPERGILTGGFPCQDLSVAGKRAGLAGERSGLFWEVIRLAEEARPEWIVLENVPGLLTSNNGRDMGIVVGSLVDRGYGVSWRVLDAQNFGVAQRRRRVFVVARRSGAHSATKVLFERGSMSGDSEQGREAGQATAGALEDSFNNTIYDARRGDGRTSVGIGPTLISRMGTGGGRCRSRLTVFGRSGFAHYSIGVTTLSATMHKRPEDNVVVHQNQKSTEQHG